MATAGFVATELVLGQTAKGQQLDDLSAQAAAALKVWTRDTVPWRALKGGVYVVLIAVPILVLGWAWLRRPIRRRAAVVGAAIITVSFFVGQAIKALTPRPDLAERSSPLPFNTLPSGHTVAAAATVVAVYLVCDTAWRARVRVAGAGYAGAVAAFVLLTAMHRLSDVLSAFFLVAAVASLASLALIDPDVDSESPDVDSESPDAGTTVLLRSVAVGLSVISALAYARLAFPLGARASRPEQFSALVAAITAAFAAALAGAAALPTLVRGAGDPPRAPRPRRQSSL